MIPESFLKALDVIIPGGAGSAISVWLNYKKDQRDGKAMLSIFEYLVSWVCGVMIAYYAGLGAIEHWGIPMESPYGVGIVFTLGIIGLNTADEILRQIPCTIIFLRKRLEIWFGTGK